MIMNNLVCGKLSYNRALAIQAGHLNHYGSRLSPEGEVALRSIIQKRTLELPSHFDSDQLLPINLINGLVPRGGTIEKIVKELRTNSNKPEISG